MRSSIGCEEPSRAIRDKSASGAFETRGKTLGIVGYGNIGSQISTLAESLGMRVIYHDVDVADARCDFQRVGPKYRFNAQVFGPVLNKHRAFA